MNRTRHRKWAKIPVRVVKKSLRLSNEVQAAIAFIQSQGITLVNIGEELGVSRRQVWEWREGRFQPRTPQLAYALLEWADDIKTVGVEWRDHEEKENKNNGK